MVRATVFGLDVWAQAPVAFLEGASAAATGRRLELTRLACGAEALGWPGRGEPLSDELEADGTVCFRIEEHPEAGYLVWGPSYGSHLLSADGRLLRCASEGAEEGAWQRLLIAQVLPFAAILNGLEAFHASAVVLDAGAVAFVGPSGSGKTSLALELCELGAGFLADDVLAVELDGAKALAHPGSPVAGVAHAEAARSSGERGELNVLTTNAREMVVRRECVCEPAPLTAMFFLERRLDGPASPRFEPLPGAQALLGATFNFVLSRPERLRRLLDVCAVVAHQRVERVLIGPAVDASRLAREVSRRMGALA